ncbi:MAG: catalase [Oligoflexus sp.]|nr:catalase [Oligoflexus sp.]
MAKKPSKPIPCKSAINSKIQQLDTTTRDGSDQLLTTNQGLKINDDQSSLKIGPRGPTLLEDFHLRENIEKGIFPGSASTALQKNTNALRFAAEAYRHCKPVAIAVDATFIKLSSIEAAVGKSFKAGKDNAGEGLIYATDSKFLADNCVEAMKQYRFWAREKQDLPPV